MIQNILLSVTFSVANDTDIGNFLMGNNFNGCKLFGFFFTIIIYVVGKYLYEYTNYKEKSNLIQFNLCVIKLHLNSTFNKT